ncbi:hypothetical protein C7120_07705 [Prevotella sp. oral taxon 376]|uniref:hypothetical protein n=1 Tax=Prevotella sp. oral taxon 376 TaxID=712466 RepID=UPI000D1F541D|nr:hypothetical protein [Prevotella sp. oral taxon 376]PTL34401.1 hypothetical protein C7120_07705 [Prevotella sp. oral taxon 376]
MKKVSYSLICLIGLSACSSENVVLGGLKVYEVSNSTCKASFSQTETHNDFYMKDYASPATLNIELKTDGIAQCVLEDVKANCAARNIFVNVTNQDHQVILIVYQNPPESLADCICNFDVNFKMSKLVPGNYHLKVYYAKTNMEYDESNIAYDGQVVLVQNQKVSVTFKSKMILPEM